MKFLEAVSKFKKIRFKKWDKGIYIDIMKGCPMVNNVSCRSDFLIDFESYDWEEYKEPIKYLTIKEAMIALISGKFLTSDSYKDSDKYIYLDKNGYLIFKSGRDSYPCFSKDKKFYIYEDKP